MQSKPAKTGHWIDLATRGGEMGREDCQDGWQEFIGSAVEFDGGTILDVGAGLGRSKERLGRDRCMTQDPAPLSPGAVDVPTPIAEIPSKSFDIVTAFDVIEHVVEDIDFIRDLVRIARRSVFVTTPNERVSHAANGCHCREYTPWELLGLMEAAASGEPGVVTVRKFVGDGPGHHLREVDTVRFLSHGEPHHAVMITLEDTRL